MKKDTPILVTTLYGTAVSPLLVLGWMNDKHYTSTPPCRRGSNRAPQELEGCSAVSARGA